MTRDEALKKVKKCMALSRSASEHEAAAALRQAQKLMEQFNLRERDVSLADVAEVQVRACSNAANVWELRLVRMIGSAFACEHFSLTEVKLSSAGQLVRTRHYVFVGIDAASTLAGYAYQMLSRQCAKARLAHIAKQPGRCKPITKTARGDAFATGWVSAVQALVDSFAQPAADHQLLLDYLADKHPNMTSEKSRDTAKARKTDFGHFVAGHRAGEQAELHRGVAGMQERALLT